MNTEARHAAIVDELVVAGQVGVAALARKLHVSEGTVRRDLQALEDQRLVRRTHGGAVSTGFAYELPLRYRKVAQPREKAAIAAAAVSRVEGGMCVGLSGGTTTTEIARTLAPGPALVVVTNSLSVAVELVSWPQHQLVLTGGVARGATFEVVGPIAEAVLDEFSLDIAFIGAGGVSDEGISTHDSVEAHTNRALLRRAETVIVSSDHTKLGVRLFARICPLGEVSTLLTTPGGDEQLIQRIRDAGVSVEELAIDAE